MAQKKVTRLAGHGLRNEGRVYVGPAGYVAGASGQGRCECGEQSPTLPNAAQRKAWHRDHKADIQAGGTGKVWTERN